MEQLTWAHNVCFRSLWVVAIFCLETKKFRMCLEWIHGVEAVAVVEATGNLAVLWNLVPILHELKVTRAVAFFPVK